MEGHAEAGLSQLCEGRALTEWLPLDWQQVPGVRTSAAWHRCGARTGQGRRGPGIIRVSVKHLK